MIHIGQIIRLALLVLIIQFFAVATVSGQTESLATEGLSDCPNNYLESTRLGLCATKQFDKAAFHRLGRDSNCKRGYSPMPGKRICILNRKKVEVTMRKELLLIRKSNRDRCRTGYLRLANSRVCVDSNLALTHTGDELAYKMNVNVSCENGDPQAKSCKKHCAPGFFRPPGVGLCIEYNIAIDGHASLAGFDAACSDMKHWKKISDNGLCVPMLQLGVATGDQTSGKFSVGPNTGRCPRGEPAHIVHLTIGGSEQSAAQAAIGELTVVPVVMCSLPGVVKNW